MQGDLPQNTCKRNKVANGKTETEIPLCQVK